MTDQELTDAQKADLEAAINLPMPERVLWLLDHVDRLKAEVERLRGELADARETIAELRATSQ